MVQGEPRPLRALDDISVGQLRHIGPKRTEALASLGIESVFDLLTRYPRRYIDRTRRVDLSDLRVGEEAAVFGEVTASSSRRTRQGKSLVDVTIVDGGERMKIAFFNQPWRAAQLVAGVQAIFFAKVTEFRGTRQMTNPVVDVVVGATGEGRDASRVGGVVPLYPASGRAGVSSWEMGGFV
ncbi:MAG: DNA helicase RecG, partial [Acidobacteriota bacterium]|nr:DNA helicase RecG [Acidobacteriota bacterium]